MTSQNNHARDSINKISNFILSEQNIDIENFTSGHLNENHLWKPPEQKSHKPWITGNSFPKSDITLNMHLSKSTVIKSLIDKSESNTNATSIDVTLSELKSPNKKKVILKKNSEYEHKLPKINYKNSESISSFPLTNKEIALHVLNSHFKGASKKEKFNSLTKYEKNVLKKEDLAANDVLHGN